MAIEKFSPCKVNLLLNILGRRPDGFHELETVMMPIPLSDRLTFEKWGSSVELTCDHPGLPVDGRNLVRRAAERYLSEARIGGGVRIHLEKRLPVAAGIGAGSANAAVTLLAMQELFDDALPRETVERVAAELGSDVPFFLRSRPSLATGRGERVEEVPELEGLRGLAVILVHPGFGISTAWAYGALREFPEALNGRPGRARAMVDAVRREGAAAIGAHLYNSLEAPALRKYPVLGLFQEYFREEGVLGTLMSGSGSTTFALVRDAEEASRISAGFRRRFGEAGWMTTATL